MNRDYIFPALVLLLIVAAGLLIAGYRCRIATLEQERAVLVGRILGKNRVIANLEGLLREEHHGDL